MVRYLTLITFTDQGAKNVKDSVNRAGRFAESVEAAGGKLLSQYWATGQYDGCVIFEAPDEKVGARELVKLAKDGNVRTQTMQIHDHDEIQAVLSQA